MGEILALLKSIARLLNICVEVWIKCNDVSVGLSCKSWSFSSAINHFHSQLETIFSGPDWLIFSFIHFLSMYQLHMCTEVCTGSIWHSSKKKNAKCTSGVHESWHGDTRIRPHLFQIWSHFEMMTCIITSCDVIYDIVRFGILGREEGCC